MRCNCSLTNVVLAALVLVFTFYDGFAYSKWIVYIAAALIIVHSLMHKHMYGGVDMVMEKPRRRRRR